MYLIGGQNLTSNITTYRWLADGTKAGVTDNEGNGFEYLGSFVYQRDVAGLNLESTSFGGGRFVASSTGEMTPFYHITDHLGSVRAVFTAEFKVVSLGRGTVRRLTTELIAQNDYYPFDLKHENPNLAQHTSNRYLYNGKEEQTTGSVNLLDYGARMYDATLGRWYSVDPLAEKYISVSPYVYAINNPILYIDPDGRLVTDYRNLRGELLYRTNDGLTTTILVHDKNISELERALNDAYADGTINDPTTNKEKMHKLGTTTQDYSNEPTEGMDEYWKTGYKATYDEAYTEGASQFSWGQIWYAIVAAMADSNDDSTGRMLYSGRSEGIREGNSDRKNEIINRLDPSSSFKNNKPLLNIPRPLLPKRYPGIGLPSK